MQETNRFLLKFVISIISILLISCAVIAEEDEDDQVRSTCNAVTPQYAATEVPNIAEYKIVSVASNKCLDIPAQSLKKNGANLQQWDCTGNKNQLFRLVPVGKNYKIVSVASNKCLDIPTQSLKKNGAIVQQWDCTGNKNQLFRLVPVGKNYKIVSVASNKCLDIPAQSLKKNGAIVQQWDYAGNNNQLFRLVPA